MVGFGAKYLKKLLDAIFRSDGSVEDEVTVQVLAKAEHADLCRWLDNMAGPKKPSIETMEGWVEALRDHFAPNKHRRLS